MNIKRSGKYWLDDDYILIVYSPRLFKAINRELGYLYPKDASISQGEEPLFKLRNEAGLAKVKKLLNIQ